MNGDNNPPDLIASTGLNDSSSPWNGLLATALQSGVSIGDDALRNALGLQTPVRQASGAPTVQAPPAPAAAVPAPGGGLTTPIILAILAVLLVLFFFMRK